MQDSAIVPGVVLVSLATTGVLIALLAVGLSRPGPQRPGLLAGAMPLALLQPVVATTYASWTLIDLFSGMALSGSGGMRPVVDACASLWMLQRVAWGVFAASCVGGLLISLFHRGKSTDDVPCSFRRGLVLFLLPALGLLAAGSLAGQLGKAMRVTVALVSGDEHDPASLKRSDAVPGVSPPYPGSSPAGRWWGVSAVSPSRSRCWASRFPASSSPGASASARLSSRWPRRFGFWPRPWRASCPSACSTRCACPSAEPEHLSSA